MNASRPSAPPPSPPLSPLPNLTVTSHNWCLRKVSVIKLFLAACTSGWQLSLRTVTGLQIAFSGLLSDSQAAQGVFCSHNTLALRGSSREATNCWLRKKKAQRAKWIGDEWCRMIGLASLLHRLIPRLPGELSPILEFPKRIPLNDAWATRRCVCACMFC